MNVVEQTLAMGMIAIIVMAVLAVEIIRIKLIVFILDAKASIREAEKSQLDSRRGQDLKLEVHSQE